MQEGTLRRAALRLVPDDVEPLAGRGERPLDKVVVVRRHQQQLRSSLFAEERRQTREEPVQRARGVVAIEHGVEIAVELPLAEDRVDVLRDAQEVEVLPVGVPTALGESAGEFAAARCEAAHRKGSRSRAITQVRARAEEGDDIAVCQQLGDE